MPTNLIGRKAERAILCNVNILTEGIDIQCVDSICLADKSSKSLFFVILDIILKSLLVLQILK